ncbi:hypothetical protein [Luteimicrobium subarcticum]|uniref:Uncharacterized protein n=1 Tax=Luteimicrobium subarcticum TaxID=620910 RepID=A0A2M8WW90_9MICO|nr:hypothetical protein [Luteimicrobium subarcticum]PJI95192.1 hypothetical protein CLV34_0065 [Luteimicrobium subarcticum]
MKEQQIIAELVTSGLADWVSLHDVVWLCTEGRINDESKRRVLGVLDRIYTGGLMVPGELGAAGFEDWQSCVGNWVPRSAAELDELAWHPMGAGFWLRLTPDGERFARKLQPADG